MLGDSITLVENFSLYDLNGVYSSMLSSMRMAGYENFLDFIVLIMFEVDSFIWHLQRWALSAFLALLKQSSFFEWIIACYDFRQSNEALRCFSEHAALESYGIF